MKKTRKEKEGINVAYVLSGVVPAGVSISMDIVEAEKILDAAREANSKFEHMSDVQIVHYCQGLSDSELDGMVSLVHGRHFENIVSEETAGVLFESKNHEDTDMALDGTEISIKSNDATADSITEFETMSPQDFGMDDAELRERTSEVMEGDIIDATDALISGTVGFGSMAVLQAAGKTIEEWEELSEYEKTNMRAAVYGTKATARAAAGTAKGTWGLLKLAGKGLGKAYQAHEEWADNGGYDKLKDSIKEAHEEAKKSTLSTDTAKESYNKGKTVGYDAAKVAIDYTSDMSGSAWDAVTDAFSDDTKPVANPTKNGGLGGFGKK